MVPFFIVDGFVQESRRPKNRFALPVIGGFQEESTKQGGAFEPIHTTSASDECVIQTIRVEALERVSVTSVDQTAIIVQGYNVARVVVAGPKPRAPEPMRNR